MIFNLKKKLKKLEIWMKFLKEHLHFHLYGNFFAYDLVVYNIFNIYKQI